MFRAAVSLAASPLLRSAEPLISRYVVRPVPVLVQPVRSFKNKKKEAAKQKKNEEAAAARLASGGFGRDPYGLFKAAITSTREGGRSSIVEDVTIRRGEYHNMRKEYSSAKMLEIHRVGKHYTNMIRLRKAAVAALPEELRAEATKVDLDLLPIERRVFTETAPIPDFQKKLLGSAAEEFD